MKKSYSRIIRPLPDIIYIVFIVIKKIIYPKVR